MLDVLHWMFEDDVTVVTSEMYEARSSVRVTLYNTLYKTPYKYASKNSGQNTAHGVEPLDFDDMPVPVDPSKMPVKPYIPPTEMTDDERLPFGTLLDSPMGA